MKYTYVGKNIEITEGMRGAVESRLSRLGNYFDCDKEVKVVMSTQKYLKKIEVTVYIKDLIIRAEESNEDMYCAIDLIVDKLERQLRKQKTRLQKKYHKSMKNKAFDVCDDFCDESHGEIVKHKIFNYKPMTDEEAVMQLELLNHDFYVYLNSDGVPSVVYKRKDGHYGVIETC